MKREWNIWDDMKRMQSEMEKMFSRFFGYEPFTRTDGLLGGPSRSLEESKFRQPLADFFDRGSEVVANIEMPGIDRKDIEITVKENSIEVKAENKNEYKEADKKRGSLRIERNYSGFYRRFTIPDNADIDRIHAECNNGILTLRIPKKGGKRIEAKKIAVK